MKCESLPGHFGGRYGGLSSLTKDRAGKTRGHQCLAGEVGPKVLDWISGEAKRVINGNKMDWYDRSDKGII
jgi:hypothetical protein